MTQVSRFVGLDVHAAETQAAILVQDTGELTYRKIRGRPAEVVAFLETVPQPFRAVYEAGPTGYCLARRAERAALDVLVCAPGHILKRPRTGSRPTSATPRSSPACCSPVSCARFAFRRSKRSSCAIWCERARTSAST